MAWEKTQNYRTWDIWSEERRESGEDNVYVANSVQSEEDADLICAAPLLLQAARTVLLSEVVSPETRALLERAVRLAGKRT